MWAPTGNGDVNCLEILTDGLKKKIKILQPFFCKSCFQSRSVLPWVGLHCVIVVFLDHTHLPLLSVNTEFKRIRTQCA